MMLKQFIHDIQWKHLIISTIFAIVLLLILGFLILSIKSDAFVFMFNTGHFQINKIAQFETASNHFVNSYTWFPLHLLQIAASQLISCWYLIKRSKGVELTNGIGHGIFTSIVLYQFDPLYSGLAILISVGVSHKMKPKKQARVIPFRPKQ